MVYIWGTLGVTGHRGSYWGRMGTICGQRTSVMREFSASRHFFKTNVTQSVAELILYSQKTRDFGHFLSILVI